MFSVKGNSYRLSMKNVVTAGGYDFLRIEGLTVCTILGSKTINILSTSFSPEIISFFFLQGIYLVSSYTTAPTQLTYVTFNNGKRLELYSVFFANFFRTLGGTWIKPIPLNSDCQVWQIQNFVLLQKTYSIKNANVANMHLALNAQFNLQISGCMWCDLGRTCREWLYRIS